ncbi:MAG TPA: hypothetical protein VJ904_09430, partial [Tichowtungia sp.]|nr:hypothetical protein [Tichowtungia sp.]
MKKNPKRLHNPDPSPCGRLKKGIRLLLRLTGFTVLLTVLLALLYLMIIGVPKPLTEEITAELQEKKIPIQIDSISLSPRQGWLLHNVRIYSPDPDDLQPVLQADELCFFIWPDDWTSLSSTEWSVSLSGKQIKISLGAPWERALSEANPFRTIDRLDTHLRVDPSGLSVDSAEVDWGGIHLKADGQFEFPDEMQLLQPEFYSKVQSYATRTAHLLAGLTFDRTPEISLHFDVPADEPDQVQVKASLLAAGLHRRGRTYEQISGKAHLQGKELQLDFLRVEQPQDGGQLQLTGRCDLASGTAQAKLSNTLLFNELLGLLPENAAADIGSSVFRPSGPADFTATFGPAPPRNLLQQVRVQIQNLPGTFREIVFDPLHV